jgi:hypothetical protein
MTRIYQFLLTLYPRKYRELFASEMIQVFQEAAGERRDHGRGAYAGFVLREMLGLMMGAAGAWLGRDPVRPAAPTGVPSCPPEIVEAQRRVDASIAGMVHAIAHHDFQKARFYSIAERKLREKLRRLKELHGISD